MPTGDLFQLLNLAPDADAFAIEGAYRLLTRRFSRLPVPEAASEVRRIQAAYDLLTNPSQRAAYHKSPPQVSAASAAVHGDAPSQPACASFSGGSADHLRPGRGDGDGPERRGRRPRAPRRRRRQQTCVWSSTARHR